MSITNIIRRKRDGAELSSDEIQRIVDGAAHGSIPDYQLSAFLMAVYFAGMSPHETAVLTSAMAASGGRLDLGGVAGRRVDKHSTGGVGDKVSLVLGPVVAACGLAVPMISGRGLGHTGGTADKLESIPGLRTDLSLADVEQQVEVIGIAMASQSHELAPADRRLYALRDVTATVESLPLITASILSKKLAENLDALVMDVKVGDGAFMRTCEDARALAGSIRDVCSANALAVTTFLTRMDAPLGRRIGNWLEVCEAVRMLRAEEEPPLVMELTLRLAGACIHAGGQAATMDGGVERARRAIDDGSAYALFLEMVARQGGDVRAVEHALEPVPTEVIMSDRAGYVSAIDARRLGLLAVELGAGRRAVGDDIAPQAGLVLLRHFGEEVRSGEALATVVESRYGVKIDPADVRDCFTIADEPPAPYPPVITEVIAQPAPI